MTTGQPLLSVRNLCVEFGQAGRAVAAVRDVSFDLRGGEVLCLLGESGCGKTVTLRSVINLLPQRRTRIAGSVLLNGSDTTRMSRAELNAIRGADVAMVFQDAALAFDPVYRIGDQIVEAIRRHKNIGRQAAMEQAAALLEMVQIPSPQRCLAAYPHELSGGMCQRAMIALALSCQPALLLADEPTTALDATVQIQILVLLREIQRRTGMAMILVTHDIGVAAEVADRIAVMYAGQVVETGTARDILRAPRHPYTQGLLASTAGGLIRGKRLPAIPGSPPDLAGRFPGCSFAPRCPRLMPVCREIMPAAIRLGGGQEARCHLLGDDAAQLEPMERKR